MKDILIHVISIFLMKVLKNLQIILYSNIHNIFYIYGPKIIF